MADEDDILDNEDEEENAGADDTGGSDDPFAGDDEADGDDPFADEDGGGDDDDDDEVGVGADDEDYGDDESEGRPFFLNPVLLASLGLALLVGAGLGWGWASFDEDAYREARRPPTRLAELPLPPEVAAPLPGPVVAPEGAEAAPEVPRHLPEPILAPEGAVPVAGAAAGAAEGAEAAPLPEAMAQAVPEPPAAPPPPAAIALAEAPPAPAEAVAPAPEPFEAPWERLALAPAPDPALIEDGANGPLPIIGPAGGQPWTAYARPYDLPASVPKIAIVIGGLGLSRAATTAAIQQLPGAVTLAFAPYAPDLEVWIAEARVAGHEVVLQLPMEPEGYPANDPGPHALLTAAEAEENLARLDWLLSRFTGYVGVTNYMGSRFTTSPDALRPVLTSLRDRGLLFLDSRETPDSLAGDLAAELEMPRAVNNRFLDAEASRVGVEARLLELERIAEATGAAVGIGFLYPVTIERVADWIRSLEGRDIALAPISALASIQPVN